MTQDPSEKAVVQEVDQLEHLLRRQRGAQEASARAKLVITAVFGVVVLAIVGATYWQLTQEWTDDKLQASLVKELDELGPLATTELDKLSAGVLPVLAQEGEKQLPQRWPQISEHLAGQVDQVQIATVDHANRSLTLANHRVESDLSQIILSSYPALEDPRQRRQFQTDFERRCDDAIGSLLDDLHGRFDSRLDRTRESLAVLNTHRPGETIDLEKRFLLLWMKLLEEEIKKQ